MRTSFRYGTVAVLLIVFFGALFVYKIHSFSVLKKQMSQPQPPALIEAVTAKKGQWQQSLKSVGSLKAVAGVQVANEVAGVVSQVLFTSGDRVAKGDVILRLDAATEKAALRTRQAEAQLAQRKFNRVSNLLPKKAVSQSDYDTAEADLEASKARANQAQATLNKKQIKAPFTGTLGIRLVDQGEYLAAGTPIVGINKLDPIYVDYTISEKELAHVNVGDKVTLGVAAMPDTQFSGKVTAIDSSVNDKTRTVRVRATVPNPEHKLRPGMFATVHTIRPQDQQVIYIPRTAISFNTYGDYVYLIKKNKNNKLVVERRDVQTGATQNGNVAVTKNLKPGDRVVGAGLLRLRAGQHVKIKTDEASQKHPNGAKSAGQASAQGGQ